MHFHPIVVPGYPVGQIEIGTLGSLIGDAAIRFYCGGSISSLRNENRCSSLASLHVSFSCLFTGGGGSSCRHAPDHNGFLDWGYSKLLEIVTLFLYFPTVHCHHTGETGYNKAAYKNLDDKQFLQRTKSSLLSSIWITSKSVTQKGSW